MTETTERDRVLRNLRNLTDLWEAYGAGERRIGESRWRESTDWPHRLWHAPALELAEDEVRRLVPDLIRAANERDEAAPGHGVMIPLWQGDASVWRAPLVAAGFEVAFRQELMSRDLDAWRVPVLDEAGFEFALDPEAPVDLTETASAAFGYPIDVASIRRALARPEVRTILATAQGQPVGTGVVYRADGCVGLHMIGVHPNARRRGLARLLMVRLMTLARELGDELAVLQASAMGLGLYVELGFRRKGHIESLRPPRAE